MFKFNRSVTGCKGNRCFYPPRSKFGCVRNVPGIVCFQTGLQIFSEAGVETFRIELALKNINVKEVHSSLTGLPSRSSERLNFGMIPPAFVLRTSARQPSLSATLRAKAGGAKEARTPDLLNAIQALYQLSYDPIHKRSRNLYFPSGKSKHFAV